MFWLIETEEQLQKFSTYNFDDVFIEPIVYNDWFHPKLTEITAYFIRPFRSRMGFIIALDHSESFKLDKELVWQYLEPKIGKIYVSDKKRSMYHISINKPIICLKTAKYIDTGEVINIDDYNTSAHKFFYNKHSRIPDINRIIPLAKHHEKWENFFIENKFRDIHKDKSFRFYNEIIIPSLHNLESNGMGVDIEIYKQYYSITKSLFLINNGTIYSQYNPFTSAGRPSNAFNSVNFAALKKDDGCRAFIIPKNDVLVEMDFSSYHVKLLCNIIGYEFEDNDIHMHLAKQYYDKEDISDIEYSSAKEMTFKFMYTDYIPAHLEHIEFFRAIKEFKEIAWTKYKEKGFIKSIISGRKLSGIESKTQLLPYLLQNYETEQNLFYLHDINELLKNYNTKPVLYTYDAILFDVDKRELEVLDSIKEILESDNFSVNISVGRNYNEMRSL